MCNNISFKQSKDRSVITLSSISIFIENISGLEFKPVGLQDFSNLTTIAFEIGPFVCPVAMFGNAVADSK